MKRDSILLFSLILVLSVAGCQEQGRPNDAVAQEPVSVLPSGTFTLSVDQLMTLDQGWRSPSRAKVVRQRPAGNGVLFDVQFPGNEPGHRTLSYVSTGSRGRMALIGLEAGAYEDFALKFTLVAINGAIGSQLEQELVVGAVIGPTRDGRISHYEPLTLSSDPRNISGIARTPVGMGNVREIGIHVHMANPDVWSPDGTVVTLRVEPADGATVLPWTPETDRP